MSQLYIKNQQYVQLIFFLLIKSSDLSCGWDEQTESIYRNVDSDAHACKPQVTFPHDWLQSFVWGLHPKGDTQ